VFLLVRAHPGSPIQRAVKRLFLLFNFSSQIIQLIILLHQQCSIHLINKLSHAVINLIVHKPLNIHTNEIKEALLS